MTAIGNTHGEHDASYWENYISEIAKREAAKVLHDRKCDDECGALIRIQENMKNYKDRHIDTDLKIDLLFKKFDTLDNKINDKINELILSVAKGSTGIVAAVFLSIAGAVITKILKWW